MERIDRAAASTADAHLLSTDVDSSPERWYRELFQAAPAGYLVTDSHGHIVEANRVAGELLGSLPERLVGRRLHDLVHDDERDALGTHLGRLVLGDELPRWEHDVRLGGPLRGQRRGLRLGPIRSSDGRLLGIGVLVQDVLGRERAEALLRGRNRVLESLASGAPLGRVLATVVDVIESVDPGLMCSVLLLDEQTRCLRVGAAQSLPAFYNEAIDGLVIGPTRGSCGAAAALGQRVVVADIQTHPNWEAYRDLARRAGLAACWSEPIRASTGQILGTVAMYAGEPAHPEGHDLELLAVASQLAGVAIQKSHAEEARRTSEARLTRVIDELPHMIFAKDRHGRFLLANQAVAKAHGTTQDALIGHTLAEVHAHGEQVSAMLADDLEVIRTGRKKLIPEESFTDHEGKTCILQTTKVPFPTEDGSEPAVLGISVDITARMQTEERIRQHQRQLRALASELSSAEERERHRLAMDLHDGFLQTLAVARMKLGRASQAQASPELTGALLEVGRLIDQVLESARSLTFEMSPPILYDMGLVPALRWQVEELHASWGLDIELEADDDVDPLPESVRVPLFRSIAELLVNVAKHAQTTTARVHVRRRDDTISAMVVDDGIGFDTSVVADRGDREGGFGLFGLRERLGHLGGFVQVCSSPGEGTTVSVVLPVTEPDVPRAG